VNTYGISFSSCFSSRHANITCFLAVNKERKETATRKKRAARQTLPRSLTQLFPWL
jgi:hypothetical protein